MARRGEQQQGPGLGGEPPRRRVNDSLIRRPIGSGSGSSAPPASWAGLSREAASRSARGLPSAMVATRAATARSTGPAAAAAVSSSRASSLDRPPSRRTGSAGRRRSMPASSSTPKSIPTRSASSRRATKPRTCVDSSSSHWTSSMRHSRGRGSAEADSSVSTARPTRNGSAGGALISPKATPSACRCGFGSRSVPGRRGRSSWCRPANGIGCSGSTPTVRTAWRSRPETAA